MGRTITFCGVLVLTALVLHTEALADNIYACPTPDGCDILTNIKKSSRCRLVMKGSASKKKGGKAASGPRRPPPERDFKRDWSEYDAYIKEAADFYNLPEYLLKAVIMAESALNPYAVSSAGAEGLMQLMPGTASDMNVKDSFNPRENIMGGARYLRMLANMFDGDMLLMLAGYNAGHNRVIECGNKVPQIDETRIYVRRVYENYRKFKKEYEDQAKKNSAGGNEENKVNVAPGFAGGNG